MKVEVIKNKYDHSITLEAETLEEAALLVDFGINATKKIRYKTTHAGKGLFRTYISIGTRKVQGSSINYSGY